MSTEDAVREASQAFYAALNRMANGESGAMSAVWSHGPDVTAMHPVGGRTVGWEAVGESFDKVAAMSSDGRIELTDQLIRVAGDVAYELGIEHGQFKLGGHQAQLEHRVTNVYRRQSGGWKMVHHHADTSPEMLEILARL